MPNDPDFREDPDFKADPSPPPEPGVLSRSLGKFYDAYTRSKPAARVGSVAGSVIGGALTAGNPLGQGAGAGVGNLVGQALSGNAPQEKLDPSYAGKTPGALPGLFAGGFKQHQQDRSMPPQPDLTPLVKPEPEGLDLGAAAADAAGTAGFAALMSKVAGPIAAKLGFPRVAGVLGARTPVDATLTGSTRPLAAAGMPTATLQALDQSGATQGVDTIGTEAARRSEEAARLARVSAQGDVASGVKPALQASRSAMAGPARQEQEGLLKAIESAVPPSKLSVPAPVPGPGAMALQHGNDLQDALHSVGGGPLHPAPPTGGQYLGGLAPEEYMAQEHARKLQNAMRSVGGGAQLHPPPPVYPAPLTGADVGPKLAAETGAARGALGIPAAEGAPPQMADRAVSLARQGNQQLANESASAQAANQASRRKIAEKGVTLASQQADKELAERSAAMSANDASKRKIAAKGVELSRSATDQAAKTAEAENVAALAKREGAVKSALGNPGSIPETVADRGVSDAQEAIRKGSFERGTRDAALQKVQQAHAEQLAAGADRTPASYDAEQTGLDSITGANKTGIGVRVPMTHTSVHLGSGMAPDRASQVIAAVLAKRSASTVNPELAKVLAGGAEYNASPTAPGLKALLDSFVNRSNK